MGGLQGLDMQLLCNCLGVPYNMSIKSLMVCALKFRSGELNSFPG